MNSKSQMSSRTRLKRGCLFCVLLILSLTAMPAATQENVVIQWNNAALQSVRYHRVVPTVAARVLAITHTCMFDAWAAYDEKAGATLLGARLRRPETERTEANKTKAISFAAYRCLVDLFPDDVAKYNVLMTALRFDLSGARGDPKTPGGIGNLAAASVLDFRHHDGSNQLGDRHPGAYTDYSGYQPVNEPEQVKDVDRWQPLRTPVADGSYYGRFLVQSYTTPHWGLVTPFALTSGRQFRPGKGPASFKSDKRQYMTQAKELLELSANLTDEQKMIAEYWADGPFSETPPGHWCLFAQMVSARDHHSLDDDVKMFFALTNALLDASIAAWDAKRAYDSVRPVTAIHFLFADQPVRAWGGRFKGTQTIEGKEWQPYQSVVMASTPPFPEFVSGHSTFSAAAAEVLRSFTGSDNFGGSYTFEHGRSKVEPGLTPRAQLTLAWPTFTAAADQAGMSRRYCGIHFAGADLAGRAMGRKIGEQAWSTALKFIDGGGPHQVARNRGGQ